MKIERYCEPSSDINGWITITFNLDRKRN